MAKSIAFAALTGVAAGLMLGMALYLLGAPAVSGIVALALGTVLNIWWMNKQ